MMGFERLVALALICVLSSSLRYCAVVWDAARFDPTDFPDGTDRRRLLLGRFGEKSDSSVRPGKFMINFDGVKSEADSVHEPGYQADEAGQLIRGWYPVKGDAISKEVEEILGTQPKVECAEDAMSLKLHGVPAAYESGLFIDQDAGPPLSLSEVPSGCGVQVHRRWWGLILTVPFVGCFGVQESDAYTLPIHLSGLPAKLSCPLTSLESKPFSVVCNSSGMTVKTPKATLVDHLWVNVKNEWLLVLKAAVRCNFNVMSESDGLVLFSPYEPCMESKDGMYSLKIAAEKEITLFCPAAQPTSSQPPVVGIPLGHEPGPVDAGASKPSSSPLLEGAKPTMVPTISLPFGPVANAGIPSGPSNQPMAPTTKSPLETGPAVNRPIVSFSLDLASNPITPTSSVLEHGPASNLPNEAPDAVSANGQPMAPTTSLPAARLPVGSWINSPLTPSFAGLPNEMPTAGSPVARLPVNWVDAPLTPGSSGLPNEMPTTGSPIAHLPVNNWVNAPLTPSSAGLSNEMPTTGSHVAHFPVNWADIPLTFHGLRPTKIPAASELASNTTTSTSQRVYGKPQQPYSSKPWYPVYPQNPVLVPVGASDGKPKLPGTSSDPDSPVLPFPGPVPPYYMNPYMYANYFNPVLMSGANFEPRPYWFNQPYFQPGPQKFPSPYPVFGPDFANPNLSPSSLSCQGKSCFLENQAPPSIPSKMGGYSPYSPPVSSTIPVGEAKSARPKSTPLKMMKSRLF